MSDADEWRVSGFDPEAVAEAAVERGEDRLSAVIAQFAGYVSACWTDVEGAGEFVSESASAAVAAVTEWLRDGEPATVVRVEPGERLVLRAPGMGLAEAEAAREALRGVEAVVVTADVEAFVLAPGAEVDVEVESVTIHNGDGSHVVVEGPGRVRVDVPAGVDPAVVEAAVLRAVSALASTGVKR